MTPEEKAEFLRLAQLAVHAEFSMPIEMHSKDLFRLMQEVPDFIKLCQQGTREALKEAGFSGMAKADTELPVTVSFIFQTIAIAISVGMDVAITMQRYGVKFPEPKRN